MTIAGLYPNIVLLIPISLHAILVHHRHSLIQHWTSIYLRIIVFTGSEKRKIIRLDAETIQLEISYKDVHDEDDILPYLFGWV